MDIYVSILFYQALTDSCLPCAAGSHTKVASKATTCTSCDAGKFSNGSSYECGSCLKGQYSPSSSDQCYSCMPGKYTSLSESSLCKDCSSGRFASKFNSTNCTSCDFGKYQGSTGQSSCLNCNEGTYSSELATTSCINCDVGLSSDIGSKSCTLASNNYYISSYSLITSDGTIGDVVTEISSKECPNNALCQGRYYLPIPDAGYWVDHSKHKYANEIYKCPRTDNCKSDMNSSCWNIVDDILHMNSSLLDIDTNCNNYNLFQCTKGIYQHSQHSI